MKICEWCGLETNEPLETNNAGDKCCSNCILVANRKTSSPSKVVTLTITQSQIESLEQIESLMYDERYKNLFEDDDDVKSDDDLLVDL